MLQAIGKVMDLASLLEIVIDHLLHSIAKFYIYKYKIVDVKN